MSKIYELNSEAQLIKLAQEFALTLSGGEVIALYGELGAGKTTFVKGIAKAMKIKQTITSPTYQIVKIYDKLVHIDAYRIHEEDLAIEEFIADKKIVCIEWPQNIKDYLPKIDYEIKIDYVLEGRKVEVKKIVKN